MVQLRSALVELGRIRVDPQVGYPAWQRDEALRETLDGPLRLELLEWAGSDDQKVLIIGAGWPRLAADFAELGGWVTVVDSDRDRLRLVSHDVAQRGQLRRVTLHDDDYHERAFDVSAFNVIVCWDSLARYSEYPPLMKKVLRELKAGGKLFVRSPVSVGTTDARTSARILLRTLLALLPDADKDVVAEEAFLLPDALALCPIELTATVEEHFVVYEARRQHCVLPDLADLAAGVGLPVGSVLGKLVELDQRFCGKRPQHGRFLALFAAKEKQLGRVFQM